MKDGPERLKKSIIISFFLFDFLIVMLVVAFFVPKIGHLINFGQTHTDEFCTECGAFRKASYATLFIKSFEFDSSFYKEDGLKTLHDAFFTPCTDHKWCVFHLVRNTISFMGKSEPHPKIGFELLKHLQRQEMKDFISSQPALASRTASVLFDYAKRGTDSRLLTYLGTSLSLADEREITLTLASMTATMAGPGSN